MKDKKFSIKDGLILLLSLVAIGVLGYIFVQNRQLENARQESLSELSEQIEDGTDTQVTGNNSTGLNQAVLYDGLVINEVASEGWVELFNSSKNQIVLKNVKLCLNGETLSSIEEETVEAAGYYVWKTNNSFGRSENQDLISITDENGKIILAQFVDNLSIGESYGCITDGSVIKTVMESSPNAANQEEFEKEQDKLSLSVPSGFYEQSFSLEISVPTGTVVYYTLDSSDPTIESEIYTEPINIRNVSGSNYKYATYSNGNYMPSSINMGTIVKAIAVDTNGTIVDSVQGDYFVGISNDSGLNQLPVLSITSDPDGLFGYENGIYVAGRKYADSVTLGMGVEHNYTQGWSRNAHMCFFEDTKKLTFEGDIDFSVVRYDATTDMAQKKIQIQCTSSSNEGSSITPFIHGQNQDFTLLNYNLDNETKAREVLLNRLIEESKVGNRNLCPVSLFLDGEYWGVYLIREPLDQRYFEKKYGISDKDVILGVYNEPQDYYYREFFGTLYHFVTQNDMSNQANYNSVLNQMDMESYVDYISINVYLANGCGFQDKAYIWRSNGSSQSNQYEDEKWRWIVGNLDTSTGVAGLDKYTDARTNSFLIENIRNDAFFSSLLRNKNFQSMLQSRLLEIGEQLFTEEQISSMTDEISKQMKKAVISSYQRFTGDYDTNRYNDAIEKISKFFRERNEYVTIYANEIDQLYDIYQNLETNPGDVEQHNEPENVVIEDNQDNPQNANDNPVEEE